MWFRKKTFTPPKGTVPFRIAPEMTYLVTPLTEDGESVDYILAMEQHFAPPGPPQENGFRDLLQTLGKKVFDALIVDPVQWRYCCRKLELDPELEPSWHYVPLTDDLSEQSLDGPWTQEQFPLVQQWIDENEPLYQLFETVVSKPVYYTFYRKSDGKKSAEELFVPDCIFINDIARCFQRRSNARLGRHEDEAAWHDALAMFQVARLQQAFQPLMISQLFGLAVEGFANSQALRVLEHARFDVAQLRKCIADLDSLRKPSSFENVMLSERFYVLDSLCRMSRRGHKGLEATWLFPDEVFAEDRAVAKIVRKVAFDWNIILKMCNDRFDETVHERSMASTCLNLFAVPPEELRLKVRDYRRRDITERSELFARRILDLGIANTTVFMPIREQCRTKTELTRLAFLLEIRRLEKGDYPDRLETMLEEGYFSQPPLDGMDRGATSWYKYRHEDSGCLLYSVGMSGRDHGGNSDALSDKNIPLDDLDSWKDDICVRLGKK